MTDTVSRLRELSQAATPGPWDAGNQRIETLTGLYVADCRFTDGSADAALIAASRNYLDALLDVVEAARDLNMTMPDTGDTDPLSALDNALMALETVKP